MLPMKRITQILALIGLLACPLLAQPAADAGLQGYDAKFVKIDVPKKVITEEVFLAKITMKNSGTQEWGPDNDKHAYLRSQEPADNTTWGANFVPQGQGRTVPVGTEYTYSCWFKAPSKPGQYVFQWRLARGNSFYPDIEPVFGEPTEKVTIAVEQRPAEPTSRAAPRRAESLGKRILTLDDFEYAGSFTTPGVEGAAPPWSTAGMALRKLPDGGRRLFVNYTHPGRTLIEVEIPELVKVQPGDEEGAKLLKAATLVRNWGKLGTAQPEDKNYGANGGLWWDEASKTMYWSAWHNYYCAEPGTMGYPLLGASKLGEDGKVTNLGPWYMDPKTAYFKCFWGGVSLLPKSFADKYTGGKVLALGFGGLYSGTANTSQGPALAAIAWPDPKEKTVSGVVQMLRYNNGDRAPRDGDYYMAGGDNWMGTQPESPTKGLWTQKDGICNAIYLDLPKQHGFVAFAGWSNGRIGYDYGDSIRRTGSRAMGHTGVWYFYDPEDLGEAALGNKKPNLPPYAVQRVTYPGSQNCGITGSCFDEENRLLYVFAGSDNSRVCAVHAYRVKEPARSTGDSGGAK